MNNNCANFISVSKKICFSTSFEMLILYSKYLLLDY